MTLRVVLFYHANLDSSLDIFYRVYLLKQFLSWYYLQVIDKKEDRLKDLRREKRKILDKVMETETYKVAKELLEKYDPSSLKESRPNSCPSSPANLPYSLKQQQQQQPQRVRYRGSMPPPMLNSSFNFSNIKTPERPVNSLNSSQVSINANSPQQIGRVSMIRPPSLPQSYPAIQAPRLARPILDQNRSIVDKLVDYVVGDGPNNRFALICAICSGHNGMALKEEFEFISFRCCYCMSFNPARKQRHFAPNISQTEIPGDKNLSPLIDEPESDNDNNSRLDENDRQTTKIAEIKEKGETSDSDNGSSSKTIKPTITLSSIEGDGDQIIVEKENDEQTNEDDKIIDGENISTQMEKQSDEQLDCPSSQTPSNHQSTND